MINQKFFEDEFHIDEILLEAEAFGLSHEVDLYAKKILAENPKMDRVDAYQLAYQEWIK
jgi:hypothetical protein